VLTDLQPLVQHGPFAVLAPLVDAAEARVRLAVDEGAAVLAWAVALDPTALPDPLRWGVPGVEATVLTPVRVLVAQAGQRPMPLFSKRQSVGSTPPGNWPSIKGSAGCAFGCISLRR
jgi:hypothetical protein